MTRDKAGAEPLEQQALSRGFCRAVFRALTQEDAALFGGAARGVLLCALPYPGPDTDTACPPPAPGTGPFGEIAPFARFNYYREAALRLKTIAAALRQTFPAYTKSNFRLFCNSRFDEKRLAAAYGLGTRGRNGLILTREAGSRFIIAGMSLPFAPGGGARAKAPAADGPDGPGGRDFALCADCSAARPPCVLACPAGALSARGGFDRTKCVQHYASGHGEAIPPPVRAAWGKRLYGCTACQDTCPRNKKTAPAARVTQGRLPRFISLPGLITMEDAEIKALFKGSAMGMSWLGPKAIRRSARCCLEAP